MIKRALKDFFQDCKYPFGKPDDSDLLDLIPTAQERVALKNMMALCKERVWIGRGRERSGIDIDKFKDLMAPSQADIADTSMSYVQSYLNRTSKHAKEEENDT